MPVIALAALMGLMFLPGSASAPGHAVASTTPATTVIGADDEPSKRPAASSEAAPYTVSMTAYNALSAQTDGDPSTTASGMFSNPEIMAARSRDLAGEMPFGTVIKITRMGTDTPSCRFRQVESRIGYRVIGDSMDSRWTDKIDVLLDETDTVPVHGVPTNPSIALGHCSNVSVTIVGHIDPKHPPKTQAELAALFTDSSLALR